jgi:hypothetical protein
VRTAPANVSHSIRADPAEIERVIGAAKMTT